MLLLSGILESARTRKDKSIALVFGTQELSADQFAELYVGINQYVFLAIKTDAFKTQEKEILDKIEVDYTDSTKTHSQRLRGVMYVGWTQHNEGFEQFKDYYYFKMEKLIDHFKSKLEPE